MFFNMLLGVFGANTDLPLYRFLHRLAIRSLIGGKYVLMPRRLRLFFFDFAFIN